MKRTPVETQELAELAESVGESFDSSHVPRHWDDIRDLDHKYHQEAATSAVSKPMSPAQMAKRASANRNLPLVEKKGDDLKVFDTGAFGGKELGLVMDFLGGEIREVAKRVSELEKREAKLDFTGPFKEGRAYRLNQAVQRSGSMWIAMRDYPVGVPGVGKSDWKLVQKANAKEKADVNT